LEVAVAVQKVLGLLEEMVALAVVERLSGAVLLAGQTKMGKVITVVRALDKFALVLAVAVALQQSALLR
jgi:hypothetical protein